MTARSGTSRAARDTLGEAVAAAQQLPGPIGPALASAARDAFVYGLNVVFAISGILSLVAAVAAVTLPGHLRQTVSNTSEPRTTY